LLDRAKRLVRKEVFVRRVQFRAYRYRDTMTLTTSGVPVMMSEIRSTLDLDKEAELVRARQSGWTKRGEIRGCQGLAQLCRNHGSLGWLERKGFGKVLHG
jgi:hypothetical protein